LLHQLDPPREAFPSWHQQSPSPGSTNGFATTIASFLVRCERPYPVRNAEHFPQILNVTLCPGNSRRFSARRSRRSRRSAGGLSRLTGIL
jgi:hypothetical protein